jgi:hypothetical protein
VRETSPAIAGMMLRVERVIGSSGMSEERRGEGDEKVWCGRAGE